MAFGALLGNQLDEVSQKCVCVRLDIHGNTGKLRSHLQPRARLSRNQLRRMHHEGGEFCH